jgi:hypothetical protein
MRFIFIFFLIGLFSCSHENSHSRSYVISQAQETAAETETVTMEEE